ncbi:MAG: LysR family transcriptional regulator [Pikeienuella sp.]
MNEQSEVFGDWDEVRVAYHVARLGTLSAAASYLGIHHATVIRRIDALEARLGAKLFQRNPRGYHPTEAGRELMRTAAATEETLERLAGNLKGRSEAVSGDLVVTSLSGLSPIITPLLAEFGQMHPEVRLTLVEDTRLLKLEYGEAHVALRAGAKPQEPDNIAQKVAQTPVTLYAHKSYVEQHGLLQSNDDANNHRFVGVIGALGRAPFQSWLDKYVSDEQVVFRASGMRSYEDAIRCGAGIGFLTAAIARGLPDLVEVTPAMPEWDSVLWLVTHVDVHRAAKVQALVKFLKAKLAATPRRFDC